jgi:PAS domain-containing protein
VLQRVHPDDVALVRRVIERAAKDQQDFDFEHRLMMPDGSIKHLHVVAHPVKDHPGKVQFMGALRDITARKLAEEAERRNEQRYRHLFHNMPVALWRVDTRRVMELFEGLRNDGVSEPATPAR